MSLRILYLHTCPRSQAPASLMPSLPLPEYSAKHCACPVQPNVLLRDLGPVSCLNGSALGQSKIVESLTKICSIYCLGGEFCKFRVAHLYDLTLVLDKFFKFKQDIQRIEAR